MIDDKNFFLATTRRMLENNILGKNFKACHYTTQTNNHGNVFFYHERDWDMEQK